VQVISGMTANRLTLNFSEAKFLLSHWTQQLTIRSLAVAERPRDCYVEHFGQHDPALEDAILRTL